MGKGMYEGILQEVRLAPFFAKAVLGIERTLDDLPGLDPELHRSLTQVLRYDGDVSVSTFIFVQVCTIELMACFVLTLTGSVSRLDRQRGTLGVRDHSRATTKRR